MAGCCPPPRGYEKLFGERSARRDAERYRRHGLDDTGRLRVDVLRRQGLTGATVIEIGGGAGAIEAEVLKAGARRAVNVELSPYYATAARELWQATGVADRAEYLVADVAADGSLVGSADAVVLHRVVCCYPDYDALVGAAAERAGRHLVLSFPRERPVIRAGLAAVNLWARLRRWEYRSYLHPVAGIVATARARGLEPAFEHRGPIWHVAGFERSVDA
jgi:2-polyprenyl-3-methyl-5-hydroxy-6-metoxy-1,4-benzoquinol methylase